MIYKTTPWAHQKKDVDRIHADHINAFALFYDMGAGKTKTAIDIARSCYMRHNKLLKTLIICPTVVLENWKREYEVHSNVSPLDIQVVDGMTKPDGKKLKNAQAKLRVEQASSGKPITIINTETVTNSNVWPIIEASGYQLLIVDESHRFKTYNSKRTKKLMALTRQPQLYYRYILTGSPILQNALDLWSQFYLLNPRILGENFFSFRAKYFYDANAGMPSNVHFPNWIPKDKFFYAKMGIPYNDDMKDLNTIIYQHASRVMKDDVLDLPPFITQKIEVPMAKEQARIYKEMRDDLVATLDRPIVPISFDTLIDGPILEETEVMSADLAIVKTLRLMQICAGVFTNEEGAITYLKTEREKILKELLEELCANKENKIIIWSVFTPTYGVISRICRELEIKYTWLTGQQTKDEKQTNVDNFNNDPEIQVIIANQGAGGTGVNLTASNYSIYYSRSFNLDHDIQSEARNYRGGQTRKVTRIDLVTSETIDSNIVDALAKKKEGAENILEVKELEREEVFSLL